MIKNYFKIALRSFAKKKMYSLINLLGLVLGISLFFLIAIWVKEEFSYDAFVPNQERVFRLETTTISPDGSNMEMSSVGWPVGEVLKNQYPEVEKLTYLKSWGAFMVKNQDMYINENILMADEHFFDVLGYNLENGNAKEALKSPYSVVISRQLASKYFGKENPVGKVLMVNDTVPYKVTGVLQELPKNSHLKFDGLVSFSTLCAMFPEDCKYEYVDGWFDINVYNYVLLKEGIDKKAFSLKIKDLVSNLGKESVKKTGFDSKLNLRSIADIYLHSGMSTAKGTVGSMKSVYFFAAIGIFILLIACLNFINLATARAMDRAKEVGIRKVLGVKRNALIFQFLTEALVACVGAGLLSLLVMVYTLPYFNEFSGKDFTFQELFSTTNLLLFTCLLVILSFLTGFYPALVLSNYQAITVLKGRFTHSSKGILLRKGLVAVQFIISITLIISTLLAIQQMKFMQSQPLGFDKENMVIIDMNELPWALRHEKVQALKGELLKKSNISRVSASTAIPGRVGWQGQFAYADGNTQGQGLVVEHIPVDYDYVKTVGLQLVAGRDFVPNSKADEGSSFLINEEAVKVFGWQTPENAIDKKLAVSGQNGKVIGVLKNYHQHGLQEKINPVVINVANYINLVALRYEGKNTNEVVAHIKQSWEKVFAGFSLTYRFLDEDFQRQYAQEEKLNKAFLFSAFLAIGIACLGLLGLITYTAEQRVKEIGIRKVLGASVLQITTLLSKDFLELVMIAFVIASPIAYYFMDKWLADFAYRITISWWIFAIAGLSAVLIALITVSWQSIKAALMNPVKSLRSE
jgi:putative ABC transport system permease protein